MADFIPLNNPDGSAWNQPEGYSNVPAGGGEAPPGAYGRQGMAPAEREAGAGYSRKEPAAASGEIPNGEAGMPRRPSGGSGGDGQSSASSVRSGTASDNGSSPGGDNMTSKSDREHSSGSGGGPSSKADREHGSGGQGGQDQKGTGASSGGKGKDEDDEEKGGAVKKGAKSAASLAQGAGNVVKAVGFAAKIQAIMSLLQGLVSAIGAVAAAVVGVVVALVMAVMSLLMGQTNVAAQDPYTEDCIVYVSKGAIGNYASTVDSTEIRMRFKRQIWSTLYYYGYRPEQIFAVIGNWTRESNLDPTSVENIFDEVYTIGTKKQFAISQDFVAERADPAYAQQYPRIERLGIGIGAWTNGSNRKLLEYAQLLGRGGGKYQNEVSAHWYDLTTQLAFALDNTDIGDVNAKWFREWGNIGTKKSFPVTRDDPSSWEFHGDQPVHVYYAATDSMTIVDTDITPIGDGVKDEYYDGFVPDDNGNLTAETCRERAYKRAYDECAYRDVHDGKYTHRTLDGVVWSQTEYLQDFAAIYRFALYEEITKYYCQQFFYTWEGGGAILDDSYHLRRGWAMDLFHQWYGKAEDKDIDGVNGPWDTWEPNKECFNPNFFKVEEGYASSIHAILDKTQDHNFSVTKVYDLDGDMMNCRKVLLSDTTRTMAEAACTLAWPTNLASRGNNGTPVYQYVHDMVMPGDTLYQSCDRTVCAAVRWSGVDDDFPIGSTLAIIQYLSSSPRWTELAWGGDRSQLQPGDVLIRKESVADGDTNESDPTDEHHVIIYVGEYLAETIGKANAEQFSASEPVAGACIVHGSYGERSPAIDTWYDNTGGSPFSQYHAYRCTYPMVPGQSKYAGYTWTPATS